MADVVDCVAHHHQAGQTQAEGEAAPFFGIDAAHPEYVGIHQAARQQLDPAAVLADRAARFTANEALDIEFESGFDDGEVTRPQPYRDVPLEHGGAQRHHDVP